MVSGPRAGVLVTANSRSPLMVARSTSPGIARNVRVLRQRFAAMKVETCSATALDSSLVAGSNVFAQVLSSALDSTRFTLPP